MQTPRQTRSSILGKRSHRSELSVSNGCEQLATPDQTPTLKRAKTSTTELDGDHNKENIPPLVIEAVNAPSARAQRALRRTATEIDVTPTRRRPTTERRASTSSLAVPATPISAVSRLSIATPPPSPSASISIHARARALLRATCDTAVDMPGRVDERTTIHQFITSFLDDSDDNLSTLYISGAPGTGKTALVNSIIRNLHLNDVKILTINCMALANVDALWDRLVVELATNQNPKSAARAKKSVKGKEVVQGLLGDLNTKCVLILDELDHITPNVQALTSLFSLPVSNPSSIRVIGIANTHTLTSSATSFSSSVQTLHFAPYTSAQLLEIIQTRFAPLCVDNEAAVKQLFPPQALTFLTKKVAALTGDVRSLFEVMRGAIDAAVTGSSKSDESSTPSVAISHILAAVKAHMPSSTKSGGAFNSEAINKVKVLGLQARIVLSCLLLVLRRIEAGLPLSSSYASPVKRGPSKPVSQPCSGVDITTLHVFYTSLLERGDNVTLSVASRSEFGDLINMLEGVGLLATTTPFASSPIKGVKRGFSRTSSFTSASNRAREVKMCEGLMTEEILKGLGIRGADARISGDLMEEEVSLLWHQELSRISKEVKIIETKASKERQEAAFGDAMED